MHKKKENPWDSGGRNSKSCVCGFWRIKGFGYPAVLKRGALLHRKLLCGVDVLHQHAEVYIVIGKFVFLFDFHKTGFHQLFHMLRNSRLRVVKMFNKVFVADGHHRAVCLHDIAKHADARRMRERVGNGRNQCDFRVLHIDRKSVASCISS